MTTLWNFMPIIGLPAHAWVEVTAISDTGIYLSAYTHAQPKFTCTILGFVWYQYTAMICQLVEV